ncbi:ankyrin repeat protein [mine drainage metagenome]|uniref:Ankyrin repeat protein n=1 Tax=mine drainage metagenome TaxID=410659 RepID=A0A1J5T0N0_9ZZZZ
MSRFIFLLITISFVTCAHAKSAADDFGARRWPVEPALTVNAEPTLCKEILLGAKEIFASKSPDLDFTTPEVGNWEALTWDPVVGESPDTTSSFIGKLDLDLDGNGKKQVVIYRSDQFNWKGNWHYAYVFQSEKEFNAALEKIKGVWTTVPQDSQYPSPKKPDLGAQQYYPSAIADDKTEHQTGDVWAEHTLLSWHNKYYFFAGNTAFDRLHPFELSLYRLHGNGTISEACRVGIKGDKEAYAKFLATPGVGSLIKVIRTMGAGGEDCGTMHSGLQHDAQAAAAERRAASRPWAVSIEQNSMTAGNPYYVFDDRTKKYLEYWSLDDSWSRREYQTFEEHIRPAEVGVAEYLAKEFAMEPGKAKSEAVRVVEELIGARFILPNQFEMTQESRDLYFGDYSIVDALVGRDKDALNSMLANPASITYPRNQAYVQESGPEALSEAVANAVEWPYGLTKMLGAGASPNQANEFGKTPLMVAAHLDRPDSVRTLLLAHADVKAVTRNVAASCSNGFERVERSALTYAAENASPIVIKLLLDAGADPSIRDSQGNGLDYYLSKNPRLTAKEQKLGVSGIAKIADRFSGPSFNCRDARTEIEKTICASEVLRIFDFEIARAYEALRAKQSALAVADQRDWIKRRNALCSGGSLSEDCLAEVMRTRIRYLHNRLGEN